MKKLEFSPWAIHTGPTEGIVISGPSVPNVTVEKGTKLLTARDLAKNLHILADSIDPSYQHSPLKAPSTTSDKDRTIQVPQDEDSK